MNHWWLINIRLPLTFLLTKIFAGKKNVFESKTIRKNNDIVKKLLTNRGKVTNILILLPHCLQNSECKNRITFDITNCKNCGKCKISELINLSKKYKVDIKVATGGRFAQRFVKELKPEVIVAVACEHELLDGISAVYPILVLAVPNKQPFGYCKDTDVEIEEVKDNIKFVIR